MEVSLVLNRGVLKERFHGRDKILISADIHTIWMNNSCGGTSRCLPLPSVSLSRSTAKSHRVTWLSDPEAANTELSVWCHSTEVIGAVWCLNTATDTPL